MKATIQILCSIMLTVSFCYGQIEATTKEGKKVILNTDGTWKYEDVTEEKVSTTLQCPDLISETTDKVTGSVSVAATSSILITKDGKNGIRALAMKGKSSSLILVVRAVGAGSCIDDKNKLNILFRDGTRLELFNDGKFNCEGKFTLYFGGSFGKVKELEMLKTKEIETMRVWTSKSYVEEDFSVENSQTLRMTIECLMK